MKSRSSTKGKERQSLEPREETQGSASSTVPGPAKPLAKTHLVPQVRGRPSRSAACCCSLVPNDLLADPPEAPCTSLGDSLCLLGGTHRDRTLSLYAILPKTGRLATASFKSRARNLRRSHDQNFSTGLRSVERGGINTFINTIIMITIS